MPKGNWKEFGDSFENSSVSRNHENNSYNVNRKVLVQRTRVGKSGKTVTMISGLTLNESEFRELLKKLKTKCGTGGTLKADIIELQGNQVKESIEILDKEGFSPKQSGG